MLFSWPEIYDKIQFFLLQTIEIFPSFKCLIPFFCFKVFFAFFYLLFFYLYNDQPYAILPFVGVSHISYRFPVKTPGSENTE